MGAETGLRLACTRLRRSFSGAAASNGGDGVATLCCEEDP